MHDIVIEMNSSLNKHTVETIIKQFVEERTGKTVSKIEASVDDNKFTGFFITYHSETPEPQKNNNIEKPKKPVVIDTTFKPMIFD